MFIDATSMIETFLKSQIAFAPILLLTLEESGIPVPIPGDIVIAYIGYQVSLGNISYPAAFFILLASVMGGSSFLYYMASKYGNKIIKKYGSYLDLNEKKLVLVEEKFKKYGPLVIIFGRHVPGFRIPITIFSGMSHISYKTFIVSTFLSVIIWIPVNLALGAHLGPRTAKLLHGHTEYFYFAAIPFVLFIIYVLGVRLKRSHPHLFKRKQMDK
jgi:membrane protein DedA with SNARE-associated domain